MVSRAPKKNPKLSFLELGRWPFLSLALCSEVEKCDFADLKTGAWGSLLKHLRFTMERKGLNTGSYGSLFLLNILELEKLVKQVGVFFIFFSIVLKPFA